jgi:hypothetical protein
MQDYAYQDTEEKHRGKKIKTDNEMEKEGRRKRKR